MRFQYAFLHAGMLSPMIGCALRRLSIVSRAGAAFASCTAAMPQRHCQAADSAPVRFQRQALSPDGYALLCKIATPAFQHTLLMLMPLLSLMPGYARPDAAYEAEAAYA